MKSKVILAAVFCIPTTFAAWAQTSDAEADAMANLLGVQKKEIVMKLVPVTGKDSVAFWKLYNEYQQKNNAMAKDRIQLYEKTALSYTKMSPALADSFAKKYFINRESQEKMLEDYYSKIKSAINAVVAFEFYQAETYLLTEVRHTIMQQIPTYGEFHSAIKKRD
jgi:hypothetical protein